MTVRVDALTPVLDAAPGELVIGRVRVVNTGDADAVFTMRVVGLDGGGVEFEVPGGPIAPGAAAEVDVPLEVPAQLGVGQHAVALEVIADRPEVASALVRMTVSVDSLERVQLAPRPSTVRGGAGARFTLDVVNHESMPVTIDLVGGAPDVDVRFQPDRLRLRPGERTWVRARITARRRWSGDTTNHLLTLTARGPGSSSSTTLAFLHRPVIPGRARSFVAGLAFVLLLVLVVAGGLWWWTQRSTESDLSDGRAPGSAFDPLSPDGASGTGPGGPGTGPGTGANGANGGADIPGASTLPSFAVVTGSVSVASGDPTGVTVRMAPIDLAGVADGAADGDERIVGLARPGRQPAKIWSARHVVRPSPVSQDLITQSVPPLSGGTDAEGVWRFVDVPVRQTYEISFSKPGFSTRSFVISPPDDGSRVELDVELEPGDGALSGVVVGSGGPLGGVEITVTDGDLTFRTTTATEASGAGQIGSFALEGLSTPGVYTLTATARGFGTEVLQLPFSAGEERSGVTVSMVEGVGSISGRITTDVTPRGGVTITASDGDQSFTTSSLTEGDVGAYSIPRLAIPGTYTVTVELPGFVTQTRRVTLVPGAANLTGIDVDLIPTTARVTGTVRSSIAGPLVGAGVTVSLDDISIRSSTAAAPVPGVFNVDDLPPGDYLVRIDQFDHAPFAQQVSLRAGQTLDLGTIVLQFSERQGLPADGSLAVRVFDSEEQDLNEATVELYAISAEVGVDPPLRTLSDTAGNQATFVFEELPVGTYLVRVTRDVYQPSQRRVSIGLDRETMEFRLFRLGQVSGQILTAGGQPLRDYEVALFRIDGPGRETLVQTRTVSGTAQPENGEILWRSEADSLLTATYRLEVTRQPPGYVVRPGQIIDTSVTGADRVMRFRIPPDSEEPVRVENLLADPLPLLGGRIFRPVVSVTGETVLEPFSPSQVAAIPDLEVRLVCGADATDPGRPSASASVPPDPIRDAIRPFPGFSLVSPANHFEFTPFVLQQEELLGDCELEVSADGFLTTTVALDTPIAPVRGAAVPPQRTVNVALVPEVDDFFGRVFWTDEGATPETRQVFLGGVDIQSSANAITGTVATQVGAIGEDLDGPGFVREVLSTISSDGSEPGSSLGDWQLDGQIAGSATYTFTSPNFTPGQILVTIAPDGTRQVVDVANVALSFDDERGWQIELTDPDDGTLTGEVRIVTRRPAADFDDVTLSRLRPGADPSSALPVGLTNAAGTPTGGNPRPYAESVAAGTWQVLFELEGRLDFFDTSLDANGDPIDRITNRIQPGGVTGGFDATLVELGELELTVEYVRTGTGDQQVPLRGDNPSYTLGSPLVPGFVDRVGEGDAAVFERLPVSAAPIDTAAPYQLSVTRDGVDTSAARLRLQDPWASPEPFDATVEPFPSDDIPVLIFAGSEVAVTVTLPQYGAIVGEVLGRRASGTDPLRFDPDDPGELLEVEVVRVVPDPTSPGGTIEVPVDDRVLLEAAPSPGTSFRLSGPPGRYRIIVAHPFYSDPRPEDQTPSGPGLDPGVFDVANTVLQTPGPWEMDIETNTLVINAFGGNVASGDPGADPVRSPIVGAQVRVTPTGDPDGDVVLVPTGPDGRVTIEDLEPGTYRVEVRRRDFVPDPECAAVDPPGDGDNGDGDNGDTGDTGDENGDNGDTGDENGDNGDNGDDNGDGSAPDCELTDDSWAATDLGYPAIFDVTLSEGSTLAERTVEATVILPGLTATIEGTIIAVNSLFDGEVPPAAAARVAPPQSVRVDRVYRPFSVQITGDDDIDNEAVDGDVSRVPPLASFTLSGVANSLTQAYGFDNVPGGRHELTFAVPDGYVLDPTTFPIDVDDVEADFTATVPPVVYRALDVTVLVELDYDDLIDDDLKEPVVSLTFGSGDDQAVYPGVANGDTFAFAGVPPRTGAYQLTVSDRLASPADDNGNLLEAPIDVVVVPNGDGVSPVPATGPEQAVVVPMVTTGALVTGSMAQADSATSLNNPVENATLEVLDVDDGVLVTIPVTTASLSYEILVPRTASEPLGVRVRLSKAGYASAISDVVEITAGQETEVDRVPPGEDPPVDRTLRLRKLATATIEVTNEPAGETEVIARRLPAPGTVIEGVQDDTTWTFELEPEADYRFEASRPGHYTVMIPDATDTGIEAPIGGTIPPDAITLVPRTLVVNVTGPATGEVTAEVTVQTGIDGEGDPVFGTITKTVDAAADGPTAITLTSIDAITADRLPLTGGATVTVSAPGFRDATASTDGFDLEIAPVGTTAADRTETVPVTLQPVVTTISGTIRRDGQPLQPLPSNGDNGDNGDDTFETFTVVLRRAGLTDPVSQQTTSSGTFSFTAPSGGSFPPDDYRVEIDVLGDGRGVATFTIDGATPVGAAVDDLVIDVRAADVTVRFTNVPAGTLTVRLDGAPVTAVRDPEVTSTVLVQRTERNVAGTYQLEMSGRVWRSIEVELGDISPQGFTEDDRTITKDGSLQAFPTFSGQVQEGTTGGPGVRGARVRLFAGTCPATLPPAGTPVGGPVVNPETGPPGNYSGLTAAAGGPGGDYCIVADLDDRVGALTVAVSAVAPTTGTGRNVVIPAAPDGNGNGDNGNGNGDGNGDP